MYFADEVHSVTPLYLANCALLILNTIFGLYRPGSMCIVVRECKSSSSAEKVFSLTRRKRELQDEMIKIIIDVAMNSE